MHRSCSNCAANFEITPDDLAFLQKLSPQIGERTFALPEPTICPDCRLQRRMSWRMERCLYFRTCDATGKKILSVISLESPFKAFYHEAWYGDTWNALDYGRPYDFSRPFFEQFAELMRQVPLLALSITNVQNCDYVNQVGFSKNCYLIIEADYDQDCLYGYRIFYNKNCVDVLEVMHSERCYECIDCAKCYNLRFSQQCTQCVDSLFLYDCRSCTGCFGCVGMRQAQHCMFNQQLSKEQYESHLKSFDPCNPAHMNAARAQFEALKLKHPRKAFIGEQNENVTGNYIDESKDCSSSFGLRGCRDCRHCLYVREAKDCMDYLVWGDRAERIYDCECCGHNIQNLHFCCDCWDGSHDLLYCFQCVLNASNCFGCVGLQKGKYCILNKQYAQEEYEALVPKIIGHMQKSGEWGSFFPTTISPYAYNETAAQENFD
ncbi:hypothetical protein HY285_05705 [Candidatus Peregrinibacteria bacterium]|nr:hypothetical protein [Candidatus Peregrinibacteria bacterium]MBI3817002.1 hypothetical protein [Candidatus Peregrinibacteria bacterium]